MTGPSLEERIIKMTALNLTEVTGGGRSRTPLEDINPDLIETIEEAFANSMADGAPESHRYETPKIGTKDEAEDWLSDARAYAWHRGQGDNAKGRIVVAGNTTKNGVVRFRVYPYVSDAE
jgi:hypothetical protein